MVEMVLLGMSNSLDFVWIDWFTIWRYRGVYDWRQWRISERLYWKLFWNRAWFSRSGCRCSCWDCCALCIHLCSFHQVVQFPKAIESCFDYFVQYGFRINAIQQVQDVFVSYINKMYLEALYYCYYYLLFILFKALGLLILVCFRIHAIQRVQDVVSCTNKMYLKALYYCITLFSYL